MSELKVLFTPEEIQKRVAELGQEITELYSQKIQADEDRLYIIGVLKGAYIFTADLVRSIKLPQQVEFVKLASYGDGTTSQGVSAPDLTLPTNISDQHVLVVEDIVDTGQTANFFMKYLREQFKPKSLKLVSFLDKPSRRTVDIQPDLCCFEVEDRFVVGYGLDYAERYRELDYLGYIT